VLSKLLNLPFTLSIVNFEEFDENMFKIFQLSQSIPVFAQCCSLVLKYGEKFEEQNNLKPEIIKIYNKALDEFFNKA